MIFKGMHGAINRLTEDDFQAMSDYAKLLGKTSRERAEKRVDVRRKWLSDAQVDHDTAIDNQEWFLDTGRV